MQAFFWAFPGNGWQLPGHAELNERLGAEDLAARSA